VVAGGSGAGKTTLALAFASSATAKEVGLLMSGTEIAEELQRVGANLGLAIGEAVDSGALLIESVGLEDESMDEIGHRILRLVDEHQVRRFVLDGLAGIADTLAFPDRGYRFLGRLVAELRRRGVTSLFTIDPAALSVAAGTPLADGVVGLFDNAFTFGVPSVDSASNGRRMLDITKVRGSQASQSTVNVQLALSGSRPPGA
jgi:circadian clock protein KaiC